MIATSRSEGEQGMMTAQRMPGRSTLVWSAFIASMTIVGGLLVLSDTAPAPHVGAGYGAMDASMSVRTMDSIFDTTSSLNHERWTEIIVYESGSPRGDAETLAREAQARGLRGLGYHFIIGNGNGLGDGDLHVGYRWNEQLPGAHFAGPQSAEHNAHAIGVCMIGNGETREFTSRQRQRLVTLVAALQQEFGIPRDSVRLYRQFVDQPNPGRYFSEDEFYEQLPLAPVAALASGG
ncbi:MAG: peptidoglycan recognition family protein [Phycisphaerales bacterium]